MPGSNCFCPHFARHIFTSVHSIVFDKMHRQETRFKLQPTWSLHQVFLLAVAVTANMIEGEEKVMLLMQLSRQLYLYLKARKNTDSPGWFPNTEGALFRKMRVKNAFRAFL